MRLLLLALASVLVAPLAAAQATGATADVSPPVAAPGTDLEIIFRIESPEVLEVALAERVTCVVVAPSGEETPLCDRAGALVELRLLGSTTREYVFAYAAPEGEGDYRVAFRLDSLLTVPPATRTAEAHFIVDHDVPVIPTAIAGQDGRDGVNGAGGPAGSAGSDGRDGADGTVLVAAGVGGGSPRTDAQRWIVSASVGAASFVALLAASRFAT